MNRGGNPMHDKEIRTLVNDILDFVSEYRNAFPPFEEAPELETPDPFPHFKKFFQRLRDMYPFFHPYYAGQMLKPPHPVALLAYFATMWFNPNNHALDGGPSTTWMEEEAMDMMKALFGWSRGIGHLTAGGTIANLEALWVARELGFGEAFFVSEDAHYTHRRIAQMLQVPFHPIPSTPEGKMKLEELENALRKHPHPERTTVVATVGTTGPGAVDPVAGILELKQKYHFRLHIDGAYGLFFMVIRDDPLMEHVREDFLAVQHADSAVVDPHKHGLQPYGSGSVLYRERDVQKVFAHTSPYTYFTRETGHLGELTFECSRAGASAGAFWLTLQFFPLRSDKGFGPILKKTRKAALTWYDLLKRSHDYMPFIKPELDIIVYFPIPKEKSLSCSSISRLTRSVFQKTMEHTPQLFLSIFKLDECRFHQLFPLYERDGNEVALLRSVLMKPEHEDLAEQCLTILEECYKTSV